MIYDSFVVYSHTVNVVKQECPYFQYYADIGYLYSLLDKHKCVILILKATSYVHRSMQISCISYSMILILFVLIMLYLL